MIDPAALAPQPAEYYRRKAAQARQAAESVTTPAIKARLLGLARDFDQQADALEARHLEGTAGHR
jgi:hypothetical protein